MTHIPVKCRLCPQLLIWLPTKVGKNAPVNAETVLPTDEQFEFGRHVNHFSDCPQADKFRKART